MSSNFVPTKSSALKPNSESNFQHVTFESYKAKPKKVKADTNKRNDKTITKTDQLDIKKVRHEVLKFGMSGFDGQKKEEAKIQLAISLGARPPKNKYKNYKLLQEERKQKREEEQKRLQIQELGKNQTGRSIASKKYFKHKKDKGGLLKQYGKATLKETTSIKNKSK